MRLFHFSEREDIEVFVPRPVVVPSQRPAGREWLNGPLVWAIEEERRPMYLFPRDCPRILAWPTPRTTAKDLAAFWTPAPGRMVAYVEEAWVRRLGEASLACYEFPVAPFESLDDAGMWVAREPVTPLSMTILDDLPGHLVRDDVDLRVVPCLTPLRDLWSTTLHVSGIRLRNAAGWAGEAKIESGRQGRSSGANEGGAPGR